ncbi:MAG: DUF3127 domain-containing protein [Bacteroidales bacterium]|nr:DUF3127 domain-containing protein [Bacteroidales bacterium]
MDVTGRLIKILPEMRGESQRGPWVRGGFVIETEDTYPRQMAFTLFGEERLAMLNSLVMNAPVVVTFSPESREYQDRWYTDLRCIRVVPFSGAAAAAPMGAAPTAAAPQAPQAPQAAPAAPQTPFASQPADGDDDLPF